MFSIDNIYRKLIYFARDVSRKFVQRSIAIFLRSGENKLKFLTTPAARANFVKNRPVLHGEKAVADTTVRASIACVMHFNISHFICSVILCNTGKYYHIFIYSTQNISRNKFAENGVNFFYRCLRLISNHALKMCLRDLTTHKVVNDRIYRTVKVAQPMSDQTKGDRPLI